MITGITTAEWRSWIQAQVDRKHRLQETGALRTRKQAIHQSDAEIDADGLAAELAVCLICCPESWPAWSKTVELGGNNRGRDLRPEWTGMEKPVEVKSTRHLSDSTGYLIIRPPTQASWQMREEYVEDSYYILVHVERDRDKLAGWIDRTGFLQRKKVNPVCFARSQLECWGVLHTELNDMATFPLPAEPTYISFQSDGLVNQQVSDVSKTLGRAP